MSFENSMIIASALQVPFSFDLWALSWEKLLVENGEAICSFGEAIAFYDYSVSSGPFSSWLLTLILNQRLGDQDQGPELDNLLKTFLSFNPRKVIFLEEFSFIEKFFLILSINKW